MQALNERKSIRSYQDKALTLEQLSDLLWAANGFNRDDKRTTPTANNRQELELYVAMKSGLYFYDARKHLLKEVKKGDFRADTGVQDFVAQAALNLIFVSDLGKASSQAICLHRLRICGTECLSLLCFRGLGPSYAALLTKRS